MIARRLQLALRMLRLPRLELMAEVRKALRDNPVLTCLDERELTPTGSEEPDRDATEPVVVRAPTLKKHLSWQTRMSDWSSIEKRFAELLIARVNDEGYLDIPRDVAHHTGLEELALQTGLAPETAISVWKTLHTFDPFGVGAYDRRHGLLLQARTYGYQQGDPEVTIIEQHLDALDPRDAPSIARELGIPVEQVIRAAEFVRGLEPAPGRSFAPRTVAIVPDAKLIQQGHDFAVVHEERGLPRLAIDDDAAIRLLYDPATKAKASEARRHADDLIHAIDQRNRTIVRVAEHLVDRQLAFFERGAALTPLIVPEVAEAVGMAESTIARVVTNKYLASPRGLIELKALFVAQDDD
jgi:RNA polymerase sigma-54 factor